MGELWFRFYPRNWRAAVRGLSPIAKAVWHDMTLVMREAMPRGFFVGASGEPIDVRSFAKDNDYKPAEVRRAIMELQNKNVFSTDSLGRIYCRFIVRQAAQAEEARVNGSLGGNPMLTPLPDNHRVNPQRLTSTDKSRLNTIENREKNTDPDSLRSSAIAFGTWPDDVATLKGLALLFIAAFANCLNPLKAEKHLGDYTAFLAEVRQRRSSIEIAWRACEDALEANGGKPLWGARIKAAKSFLPLVPRHAPATNGHSAPIDQLIAELREQEVR